MSLSIAIRWVSSEGLSEAVTETEQKCGEKPQAEERGGGDKLVCLKDREESGMAWKEEGGGPPCQNM